MRIPTKPREYEELAFHADISMAEACRMAGVRPAVFAHWRAERHVPSIDKVERIYHVLTTLTDPPPDDDAPRKRRRRGA